MFDLHLTGLHQVTAQARLSSVWCQDSFTPQKWCWPWVGQKTIVITGCGGWWDKLYTLLYNKLKICNCPSELCVPLLPDIKCGKCKCATHDKWHIKVHKGVVHQACFHLCWLVLQGQSWVENCTVHITQPQFCSAWSEPPPTKCLIFIGANSFQTWPPPPPLEWVKVLQAKLRPTTL